MDNISKALSAPLQSTLSSEIALVFSAAQSTIAQSAIVHSGIAHSPVVESKIAQSLIPQPKAFQAEISESEFLNLSFDELSKVAVRTHSSNQIQNAFQAKAALEVKSKENFLEMPLEKLMNLPVRMATLGKNDKDKDKQDTQDVTSNPTSINFEAIPVFSKQALESVSSYQTNTENTSTSNTITDTPITTTTTTTTTTVPPITPSVNPIPIVIIPLPQFLAVSNSDSSSISILLRNNDGTFTPQPTLFIQPGGGLALGGASGDFNGDGILDFAVCNFNFNNINIFLGTSIAAFAAPTSIPSGGNFPTAILTADFNGDGILDLAVINDLPNPVAIFLGIGNGTFGTATIFPSGGGSSPNDIVAGDFNGDGLLDLAVLNNTNISILLGTGGGGFGLSNTFPAIGTAGTIITADFNKDGILDLAISSRAGGVVSVYLGEGNGTFGSPVVYGGFANPSFVITGDFNNDGNLDLAIGDIFSNNVSILLGTGTGTFVMSTVFPVGSPGAGVVSDFNHDGNIDLAVSSSDNILNVLYGTGDGTFINSVTYPIGANSEHITLGILPAGVSGSPINLGLIDPMRDGRGLITLTIDNIPLGCALNAGVNNLDGSWTVQTMDPQSLTITTLSDFVGARTLEVDMSWVSSNGEIEHVYFKDNIEAYAPGVPIFALPGDNLTGSIHADMFVISKSQPCINDKIFNFDVILDKIDLINFENVNDFSDLIIQNDIYGNALIHLGVNDHDNQSVLLYGVDANQVTDSNFLFNITPHTINTDKIDIGTGSIMPFYGVLENNGIIQVDGTLIIQGDITGTGKIILGNSGVLELKGHLAQDVIFESSTMPIIFNHLDFTLASVTTISLQTLLENNQNVA